MIVIASDFLNQHQLPLVKELYDLTGGECRYIELRPMTDYGKRNGYDNSGAERMLVPIWKGENAYREGERLFMEAKAVIVTTNGYEQWTIRRVRANKLTFEYGERWLKRGLLNLLSPRLVRWRFTYRGIFGNVAFRRLCNGAFVKNDMRLLGVFRDRCYKWGYFTRLLPERRVPPFSGNGTVRILYVSNMIGWKRPGMAVKLAEYLVSKGHDFIIDIYGTGTLRQRLEHSAAGLIASDKVRFHGTVKNSELLQVMQKSDIVISTSSRREGWGAVINEAMSAETAVVASDHIGSVPYLIQNGVSGLTFRSGSQRDFNSKVESLIENRELGRQLARNARERMATMWSPGMAARNLLTLIQSIEDSVPNPVKDGPASMA